MVLAAWNHRCGFSDHVVWCSKSYAATATADAFASWPIRRMVSRSVASVMLDKAGLLQLLSQAVDAWPDTTRARRRGGESSPDVLVGRVRETASGRARRSSYAATVTTSASM